MTESEVFAQGFTGLALYDPQQQKWLYQQNSDKYFTPASNTKILTLYTALELLGDRLPALRYSHLGDTLLFWGTGDPTLWHPQLPADSTVEQLLKNHPGPLYYSASNVQEAHFGPGWAWDDYYFAFQTERSAMPLYSNRVRFVWEAGQKEPRVEPPYFAKHLKYEERGEERVRVWRHLDRNAFTWVGRPEGGEVRRGLPFRYSDSLLVRLLGERLEREVGLWEKPIDSSWVKKTLYSLPVDTVYRRVMHQSDNFLAEQVLMMCSEALFDTIDVSRLIDTVQNQRMPGLPDRLRWVDGSGLSRYNLFTPRAIVHVLDLLRQKHSQERLFDLFAAGGQSGTIRKWYAGPEGPIVYAKTGTMSNKHCLSGYLIGRSGRVLIFSFMHNNYPKYSRPYKEEMQGILLKIHAWY